MCENEVDIVQLVTALRLNDSLEVVKDYIDLRTFHPETCQILIKKFDKSGSGKLDLAEFESMWVYLAKRGFKIIDLQFQRSANTKLEEHLSLYVSVICIYIS